MPAPIHIDRPLGRERSLPPPVPAEALPAQERGAPASVLALQRSAGNAAVSSAIAAMPAPWVPAAPSGSPALLATLRSIAPQRVARAAGGRCPCGGIVPPGEEECAECRRKRSAKAMAVSPAAAGIAEAK